MRAKIFSMFLLFVCNHAISQITFQKTYGNANDDKAFSVIQTIDKGFIIAGSTQPLHAGWSDILLIKTNELGDTLWTKTFGDTRDNQALSVRQTNDSGYIVVGKSGNSIDVCLIKTDMNGDLQWAKAYGDSTIEDVGYSVEQNSDGGYIIAGVCRRVIPVVGGVEYLYLIRTNSVGDTLWTKLVNTSQTPGQNGRGYSVKQTLDGGFIAVGESAERYTYVVKTDSDGNLQWTKLLSSNSNADFAKSIELSNDGGYFISGSAQTVPSYGISLIKMDSLGSVNLGRCYQRSGNDFGTGMRKTNDGGFILVGETSISGMGNNLCMIKVNSLGILTWAKSYGGTSTESSTSVIQLQNGGYVISGTSKSFGLGDEEVYLIKTDSLGNSGCYDSIATFSTSVLTVTSTNAAVNFYSLPTTIVRIPSLVINSGISTSNLCFEDGISKSSADQLNVLAFPNPFHSELTIQDIDSKLFYVRIKNIIGQTCFISKDLKPEMKINLEFLKSGLYFLELNSKDKTIVKKIIKE